MTTITDEAIEEACDGFYTEPRGLTRWAKLVEVSPDIADRYRVAMSHALTAALPHIEAAIRADERERIVTRLLGFADHFTETHTRNGIAYAAEWLARADGNHAKFSEADR